MNKAQPEPEICHKKSTALEPEPCLRKQRTPEPIYFYELGGSAGKEKPKQAGNIQKFETFSDGNW